MGRKLRKPIRLVLVIGDLHCGSTVGLCPPGMGTFDGSTHGLNPIQEWIWEQWMHMRTKWLPKVTNGDPFILVVNGDLTEGLHHRTPEVISARMSVHAKAAIQCLSPLVEKADATYIVRGTECHVGSTGEADIGHALGSEIHPESGEHSAFEWYIRVNGTLCAFKHHIPASVRKGLLATQLSLALFEEQGCAASAGHPVPRVICRAHRHQYGGYDDCDGVCVVTPPWQLKTAYGHKVVPSGRPHVGAVLLDFRDKQEGEPPDVRKFVRTVKPAKEAVHG